MLTRSIPPGEWRAFFDQFSRRHRGCLITLEEMGTEIGAQVEAEGLALEGITAKLNDDGVSSIEIMVGEKADDHITHFVAAPVSVNLEMTDEGTDSALEIKSADGTATLMCFQPAMQPELVEAVVV